MMLRRFVHPVFTALAALSLLACLAIGVAWRRSYAASAAALGPVPAAAPGPGVESWRGRFRFVVPLGRQSVPADDAISFPPRLDLTTGGGGSNWSIRGVATRPLPGGGQSRVRNFDLSESAAGRSFHADAVDQWGPAGQFAGFTWHSGRSSDGPVDVDTTDPARSTATFRRWGALVVPHAYLLVAALVLPVWWTIRVVRRRKLESSRGFEVRTQETVNVKQ